MATTRKPSSRRKAEQVNEELLAELNTWASSSRATNDPYVKALVKSLETFENIEAIAEINPLDYLPHYENASSTRKVKTINILTIFRNVLVFAPVALTWLGVSKATTGFSLYTKANPDAVVNFLDFWQNGYGVLAEEWKIGQIAILDFYLIAIVIALTLITALMTERHQRDELVRVAKLDQKRIDLGIKLHTYLFAHRKVTAETVNARVATAVRNLAATSKSMAQSSKELRKDINAIPSNKQVLAEIKKMNKS